MTTPVPQPPTTTSVPPAGSSPSTAPWVVAVLAVLITLLVMGLCVGVGLIAWLRPGAATPITVMATMMAAAGTVAAPFVSMALMGRRR
ncbi:hypothetical protein OG892_39635 [Streptomyces sp. NBC_00341]|uniref:hypothetical protein n=1 Tax=Streptomyces sp. NBC_00341 TaxID=2975717 RepID=UPI00308D9847|nr:hypothetical protein OG892_39635 [Streptomyces sp. NBC_00341]